MSNGSRVYSFGSFRLDSGERVLIRAGKPLALTPKAFAILLALLERHTHIVEKADLMQAVWPDTAVEEGNLTQNVHTLRKVLGTRDECGVVIETVPRRGYRLIGDVTVSDGGALTRANATGNPGVQITGGPPSEVASATVAVLASAPGLWRTAAAFIVLGVFVAVGLYWWNRRQAPTDPETAAGVSAPLVARPVSSLPGEKLHPALSPDGDRVAFVWERGEGRNIYILEIGSDSTLEVTRGPGDTAFPAWAPDGGSIAFIRRYRDDAGRRAEGVFVTSVTGGPARTLWLSPAGLTDFIGSGLDWSPDGAFLALSLRPSPSSPLQLALLSVASRTVRWPSSEPGPGIRDDYPTFSPAGELLAFVRRTGLDSRIVLLPLAGGTTRTLPVAGHDIRRLAWSSDGHGVIFASRLGRRLWITSPQTNETELLAAIAEGADDPSISRSSGRMVFRQPRMDQNLYRADLTGTTTSVSSLAPTTRRERQGSISPDGSRVAFISARTGVDEVWVMQSDGAGPAQLTDLRTGARHPRWSPDGRSIAVVAYAPGSKSENIYITEVVSRLTRRLTTGSGNDVWPAWSHDNAWIYFTSNRSGKWKMWKVQSSGGQPQPETDENGLRAWQSSDGRFLYYSSREPVAIWRKPIAGGDSTLVLGLPAGTAWGGECVVTSRGVYWVNQAAARPTIELHDFRTNRSTVVVTPPGVYDHGSGFSVAPDGTWLVFGQQDYEASDLLMLDALAWRGGSTLLSRP